MPSSIGQSVGLFLLVFPSFVFAYTFDGFFKALTAHLLGDTTPKNEGFLSLNPIRHVNLDVAAMLIGGMLLASAIFGNSPLSSMIYLIIIMSNLRHRNYVPINEHNFKDPVGGEVLTLLAGPAGSLLYAFLCMICMRLPFFTVAGITAVNSFQNLLFNFLDYSTWIGIFISVFALIPFPPQAAGQAILLLIPEEYEDFIEWYSTYGMFILLGLIFIPGVEGGFFNILWSITQGIKIMMHTLVFKTF